MKATAVKDDEKGSWIVTLQEVIVREYRCENCTKEEARANPWDHAVGQSIEIECNETQIIDVEPAPPKRCEAQP